MKKRKNKTSAKQLAYVRDWEKRNPERAQARKNAWFQSEAGRAWLKEHQNKRNAARKAWRERKRKEAVRAAKKRPDSSNMAVSQSAASEDPLKYSRQSDG